MAKQQSIKAIPLSRERLSELELTLRRACDRMEALDIPDVVIHNDLNPGNILFHGPRCTFIDWCEVGVGSPFFTLQYLCRLQPDRGDSWTQDLTNIFRRSWRGILGEYQIEKALALAPLLGTFSHLLGRGTWLRSVERDNPNMQSYARSLARDMERAAKAPELTEALCY